MEKSLEKTHLTNVRITTVIAAVSIGILAIFYRSLPPQVPLLYTLSWGDDQIVAKTWLFLLPGLIIVAGVISGLVISKLGLEKLLLYIYLGSVWAFQAIVMLGLIRIVWLVA